MPTRRLAAALVCLWAVAACTPPSQPATTDATTTAPPPPTATTAAPRTTLAPPAPVLDPSGSYAVLVFASHIPVLEGNGSADRPWTRLHTARNLTTVARLLAETGTKAVLGYSPTLLEQIAAVAEGRPDRAAAITAVPAAELTPEDKAYIDEVFFFAGPAQLDQFPRLRDLAERRAAGRTLSTSEYRDAQVLFNLAWSSRLLLETEPLATLAAQGRNYSEDDKATVLEAHRTAAADLLGIIGELWETGTIEVATTPLYNPTLPLLVDSRLDEDAAAQIVRGVTRAGDVLGKRPVGMVPAGGLVDAANATALHEAGIEWLVLSGETATTPFRLASEAGTILALNAAAGPGRRIADTYFDVAPATAADRAVAAVADRLRNTPGAITVVAVDGIEPWSRYEDGGIAFLRELLQRLGGSTDFAMALPGELTSTFTFDPGPYPPLPAEYLQESRQRAAWTLLTETRAELRRAEAAGTVEERTLDAAYELVLQAEDADWYWWYGIDRASGEDAYRDEQFRARLRQVWELLGQDPPDRTAIPLHEAPPVAALRLPAQVVAAVTIDNRIRVDEWRDAGRYEDRATQLIRGVRYSFDDTRLFVRVDFATEVLGDRAPGFDLYLRAPGAAGSALTPRGNGIGFAATHVASWRAADPVRISPLLPYRGRRPVGDTESIAGFDGDSVEFALNRSDIAERLRPGDRIDFRFVDVTGGPERELFPSGGRGTFEIPNLEEGVELGRFSDRIGDDHGPGGYSYVVDSETAAGTYDLSGLVVRLLDPGPADPGLPAEVQFEVTFRNPLRNPWSAPHGFSHQTVDVYLDADPGAATGARQLLPGRVAATPAGSGWDYALSVDGWGGTHYVADGTGIITEITPGPRFTLLADKRTILVTVPRSQLPAGSTTGWQFGVAVLANQAIPTLGIHGLRALAEAPGRYHLGGGTNAANDPRIIDLLHPDIGAQEAALTYPDPVPLGSADPPPIDKLAVLPLLGS